MRRLCWLLPIVLFITICLAAAEARSVLVRAAVNKPYAPPEESVRRFSRAYTDTLLPSAQYTALYPFPGQWLTDTQGTRVGYLYGFANSQGSIVVDAVYSAIEPLYDSDYTAHAYMLTTADSQPYVGFCGLDGSWATEFAFTAPVQVTDSVLSLANAQGLYGAIDYNGLEAVPFHYPSPLYFYDNLTLLADDNGYYYLNTQGEVAISGPFADALPFASARAAVTDENGVWGYINPTGAWVLDPQFAEAGPFNGTTAVVRRTETPETTEIIDKSGTALLVYNNVDVTAVDRDIYLFVPHDENDSAFYYYAVNAVRATADTPGAETTYLGGGYFAIVYDGGLTIFDAEKRGQFADAMSAVYLRDNRFLLRSAVGWGIADINGNWYVAAAQTRLTRLSGDVLRAELSINGQIKYRLLDSYGKALLDGEYNTIEPVNGIYMVTQDEYNGILSASGTWLLKQSLLPSLRD